MKIINNWIYGLTYPFKEKDWINKMWLIPLTGVLLTPFVQLIALRGWRVELVKRIGLKVDGALPKADLPSVARYTIHGVKLWAISFVYLIIPIVIFSFLRINPFRQLIIEVTTLIGYLFNNDTGLSLFTLFWSSFKAIMYEVLVKNIWLVFYYPYYRTATIRYALTGKLGKSHFAFIPNVTFVVKNVRDFIVLMFNQLIDKSIIFFLNALLTVVLTPFISIFLFPMFLFFADYWSSGYDYGKIAIKMVEQEYPEMLNEDEFEDEYEYEYDLDL